YQPLMSTTDIRQLTLLPGGFDDQIECRIDDGKMECTGRINVDRREFLVTPNCMMALQRTRSRGAEKVIWIDAVCMNQKDTEQRGHQVQVMPQIYSRAQHVLIYVGELALEDESLLRMLQ
ncbi:hypothetical protein LY78DRAFT_564261, partial [Colletotrichum sublineola]